MVSEAGKADWRTPDHPTSLFEGLAGGVCLLAELHAAAEAAGAAGGQQQQEQQPTSETLHQAVCRLVTFPLYELSA